MWKQHLKQLNTPNNRIIVSLIFAGIVAMIAGFMANTVLQVTSEKPAIEQAVNNR